MINTAVILIRFSVSIFGTFDCWILFFFSSLYLYSYLTYLIIHLISLARNTFLYPPDLLPFILLYPLMPAQIKHKKNSFPERQNTCPWKAVEIHFSKILFSMFVARSRSETIITSGTICESGESPVVLMQQRSE